MSLKIYTPSNKKVTGCPSFLVKSKSPKIQKINFHPDQANKQEQKKSKILIKSLEIKKDEQIKQVDEISKSKTPSRHRKSEDNKNFNLEVQPQYTFSTTTTQDSEKCHLTQNKNLLKTRSKSHSGEEFEFLLKLYKQNQQKENNKSEHQHTQDTKTLIRQNYSGCISTIKKNQQAYNHQHQEQTNINDFQYIRELGKGFFGAVFLAKHKKTGILFAIKVIEKKQINSDIRKQNLFRELKIHSFVKHSNVISLYKIIQDSKYIYMVIEYANGGSLFSQLKNQKQFSELKTSKHINNISQGVKYLHDEDIIHRDIKLQNIVICQGVAKIADFGCAVKSIGMRKSNIGSPAYLSPQQLNHHMYGKKIDVWAIGIMAYEMLFGVTPFDKQIMSALKAGELVSEMKVKFPSGYETSEEAKDFIEKCLDKKQNQRMSIEKVLNHPFLQLQKSLKQ